MDQQIEYLTRVQNIEIESRATQQRIGALSKEFETLDVRLQDFQVLMAEESQQNDILKKEYREFEMIAQDNLNAITKSKDKLALAKNNKEYQSCLKEIEELEKKNSAIEDNMLEILDKIEAAEDSLKAREKEYALIGEEVEQSRQKLSAEIEARQQNLEALNRNLAEARQKIEPELLEIFERTKQLQANHIALARVVDEVCQGCNVTIPAQLYNELHRRDSLKFCPKCGRIAYWSESAR